MAYIEIKIHFSTPEPWKDVFTSLLGEVGCDSFIDGEDDHILLCYIKEQVFNEQQIRDILDHHGFDVHLTYLFNTIEEQNWNAVWESNYTPVLIADQCYIRAPFHEANPNVPHEIIIEPKMSFGTAHHETTSMMIEYLLEDDFQGKDVLDMGSGTGILAILAHQRGAKHIVAIDNDPWAYENNLENNERNQTPDIIVKLGDANAIGDETFDCIIANINRNILLADMHLYAKSLRKGGYIYFSGFYQGIDLDKIKEKAATLGIHFVSNKEKNNWVAAKFIKA